MAEPTGGGTGEDIRTENGVMSLLVPGYVRDEIMGMTLDEFGEESHGASKIAQRRSAAEVGRARPQTAMLRFSPNGAGGEVGPAGAP